MDGHRFDVLTRRMATGLSRRAAVVGAATGLLGLMGLRRGAIAQVSQAECGNQRCRTDPGRCNDGCVCCVYTNPVTGKVFNDRCRPPGTCAPGQAVCAAGEGVCPDNGSVTQPGREGRCAVLVGGSCPNGDDDCCSGDCFNGTCVPRTCFVAGTRVAMADGSSRPIELVTVGDRVLARNGGSNTVVEVERTYLGSRLLYALNGSAPFVTAEHPFATESGWKSVDPAKTAIQNPRLAVERLAVGDRLMSLAEVRVLALAGGADEEAEVRLEPLPLRTLEGTAGNAATPLYNLLLDGDHAYFADDLLVHNRA